MTISSFDQMDLAPHLIAVLGSMKLAVPTAIQAQSIPMALTGMDAVVIAQTGSGKTLAFLLPVISKLLLDPIPRALVLVPNREVAEQVHKVLLQLLEGTLITASLIIGGTPNKQQVSQLKKRPRVIIATPGRMNDHLQTNKLLLQNVGYLVIDEADRMLDLGFASQLKNIRKTMRGDWQTLLYSASISQSVEKMSASIMKPNKVIIRTENAETPVTNLKQKVFFVERKAKSKLLIQELRQVKDGAIVFVRDQPSCDYVNDLLSEAELSSDYIHGGLIQGHRNRVLRDFRAQKFQILVTTDLLARGLDVAHIECVINFDLPFKPEDFLHRIGRTARADRKGLAVTFITPEDKDFLSQISDYIKDAEIIK